MFNRLLERITRKCVPNTRSLVATSGQQLFAVRTEGHRSYRVLMSTSCALRFSRGCVPRACGFVGASSGDDLTIATKCYCGDCVFVFEPKAGTIRLLHKWLTGHQVPELHAT